MRPRFRYYAGFHQGWRLKGSWGPWPLSLTILSSCLNPVNFKFDVVLDTLCPRFANMWCDQAKSVWSRSYSIISFLLDCNKHLQSYILQKTPLKLNNQFKRYQQLKSFQNKRKQKDSSFVWLYLKINISDIRLILLDHITDLTYFISCSTFFHVYILANWVRCGEYWF